MSEVNKPFFLGFVLWFITLSTILLTIVYLCTINVTIDVIIKQVCLAAVAKVSIFYAGALSETLKIKQTGIKPI